MKAGQAAKAAARSNAIKPVERTGEQIGKVPLRIPLNLLAF